MVSLIVEVEGDGRSGSRLFGSVRDTLVPTYHLSPTKVRTTRDLMIVRGGWMSKGERDWGGGVAEVGRLGSGVRSWDM